MIWNKIKEIFWGINYSESPSTKRKDLLKFKKIHNPEFHIIVGSKVSLWNKPNSDIVNIYAQGSTGGQGLVGFTKNYYLSQYLLKGGSSKAIIVFSDSSRYYLKLINSKTKKPSNDV